MTYGFVPWSRRGRRSPDVGVPEVEIAIEEYADVDVAIVCESTYPYLTGGLSAVVHQICVANPDATIGIIHISWDASSPLIDLYDVPPQVKWVKPVFQSLAEHATTFKRFTPRAIGIPKAERDNLAHRIFDALDAHFRGSDDLLWRLYDEGINPLTRSFRIWPIISTVEFMEAALEYFRSSGLSFTSLFWSLREFFSLAFSVTDTVHPRAKVYHAHTTGAASVLAAAAARQHDAAFLLTEHNLYARDTINHALGRAMDTVVRLDDWRTLDHYVIARTVPTEARVTPDQRAWMAWWSRLGVIAYRAAAHVTYLYPDAIVEASGLGAVAEKSSVLPNGVTPEHFDDSRAVFEARQTAARNDPDPRIWRLAYAARVVPIKGLLDLLQALAALVADGVDNWELDVMGPDQEMPDYAERCRTLCCELGLDGHVRFVGSVNLRERFGHYDVLLLPSHNEGQPIVVLEAMTIGLPTIGTYVGGMKQLVEDPLERIGADGRRSIVGPAGSLVHARDVAGLTREISALLRDPDQFMTMSRNARVRAEQHFHIDTAMQMYRDLYSKLTGTTTYQTADTASGNAGRIGQEIASSDAIASMEQLFGLR